MAVTTTHLKEEKIRSIADATIYPRLSELILKVVRGHRQLANENIGLTRFVETYPDKAVAEMMNKIYDWILRTDTTATFFAVLKKPLRVNEDHKREKRTLNTINRPPTYRKINVI